MMPMKSKKDIERLLLFLEKLRYNKIEVSCYTL